MRVSAWSSPVMRVRSHTQVRVCMSTGSPTSIPYSE